MHEVRFALQVVGRQTRPVRRPSGIVAEGASGRMPREPPRSTKDRGGVPPGATMQRGHPSREAAGAGCRGESFGSFWTLAKGTRLGSVRVSSSSKWTYQTHTNQQLEIFCPLSIFSQIDGQPATPRCPQPYKFPSWQNLTRSSQAATTCLSGSPSQRNNDSIVPLHKDTWLPCHPGLEGGGW